MVKLSTSTLVFFKALNQHLQRTKSIFAQHLKSISIPWTNISPQNALCLLPAFTALKIPKHNAVFSLSSKTALGWFCLDLQMWPRMKAPQTALLLVCLPRKMFPKTFLISFPFQSNPESQDQHRKNRKGFELLAAAEASWTFFCEVSSSA